MQGNWAFVQQKLEDQIGAAHQIVEFKLAQISHSKTNLSKKQTLWGLDTVICLKINSMLDRKIKQGLYLHPGYLFYWLETYFLNGNTFIVYTMFRHNS